MARKVGAKATKDKGNLPGALLNLALFLTDPASPPPSPLLFLACCHQIGEDAMAALNRAKKAQEDMGRAIITGHALNEQLAREQMRGNSAEGVVADMQRELAESSTQLEEQRAMMQQVRERGRERREERR
jgi:hypothetical protein